MENKIANELKVIEAYSRQAKNILDGGNRFKPVYIASKALSDWLLLSKIELKEKSVLNIGCSEPIDELQFIEIVNEWIALDINEKMIKTAQEISRRKLHPKLFEKLVFIEGDAAKLPYKDNTFDVIVSFSAIEHIPDTEIRSEVIKEMSRVIKKGGHIIITVPNKFSIFYFTHRRNMKLNISDYGYAHLFTPKELKLEYSKAGLKIKEFTSEIGGAISLMSYNIEIFRKILWKLRYFGERIGVIGVKE